LDPYWELGEPAEPATSSSSSQPSVVMMQDPAQNFPPAPVSSPKVIEVPLPKSADGKQVVSSQPTPPAIFILTNGQRIEAKSYLLTNEMLQVQHGRDQQTIPLNDLNFEATVAANHERGIDLEIPENRNQLTLGF
jgi:hypothetical protein